MRVYGEEGGTGVTWDPVVNSKLRGTVSHVNYFKAVLGKRGMCNHATRCLVTPKLIHLFGRWLLSLQSPEQPMILSLYPDSCWKAQYLQTESVYQTTAQAALQSG